MKIKDLFQVRHFVPVYMVTSDQNKDELEWDIEPQNHQLIPDGEGTYCVAAKQIYSQEVIDCFLLIALPERIAEIVINIHNGGVVLQDVYEPGAAVIPAMASDCYGDYNLYLADDNPEIGIGILKDGLIKSTSKSAIAEDLGYILRDLGSKKEAIDAFLISEEYGPSSEYIYQELSGLYEQLGEMSKAAEYQKKFNSF